MEALYEAKQAKYKIVQLRAQVNRELRNFRKELNAVDDVLRTVEGKSVLQAKQQSELRAKLALQDKQQDELRAKLALQEKRNDALEARLESVTRILVEHLNAAVAEISSGEDPPSASGTHK